MRRELACFGIQNKAFKDFIDQGARQPKVLMRFVEGMTGDPHPVVGLAGGWAAAQIAMGPARNDNPPLGPEARKEALTVAETFWAAQDKGFERLKDGIPQSRGRLTEWNDLRMSCLTALAYLPSMRIVTARLGGEVMPSETVESLLDETNANIVALGAMMKTLQEDQQEVALDGSFNRARRRLVAAYLLQSERPSHYIVTPSSLQGQYGKQGRRDSHLSIFMGYTAAVMRRVAIWPPQKLAELPASPVHVIPYPAIDYALKAGPAEAFDQMTHRIETGEWASRGQRRRWTAAATMLINQFMMDRYSLATARQPDVH